VADPDPERASSRRCNASIASDEEASRRYRKSGDDGQHQRRARVGIRSCVLPGTRESNMSDISPDLFMDAVLAYQQTAAIKAALEICSLKSPRAMPRPRASRRQPEQRFVAPAYFAITSRSATISNNWGTSSDSRHLRARSWTEAFRHGWAASSSIWPRPR